MTRRLEAMKRLGSVTRYVVAQDDTLSRIAAAFGTRWRTIYEHPANEGFRRRRPDPNIIVAGDVVFIPMGRR